MSSVDGYGVQKKVQSKVEFRKKLKLSTLRESEVKEEFTKEVTRTNVMAMRIGVTASGLEPRTT